jgi:membrane fusion protein, multidrug efflux system
MVMQVERKRYSAQHSPWINGRCIICRMAVIPLLALFFVATGCEKSSQDKPQAKSAEVSVITVEARDVPVSIEYVAQTQSSRLVNIQARVNGFLEKRVYIEGSMVKKGQTLFIMDQKPFKVQVEQAQAAMAGQMAALETARANLARVKPLAERNALSKKDLDDSIGQVRSYEAAVAQAKAQVETAKLNLSYTVITAPVDGISSYAQQTEGTYISQQNSLLTTVAVLSPMWINFSISENELQSGRDQIKKGLLLPPADHNYLVEVRLVDGTIFPHTGKITFAESSFNAQTGTFLLRASVDNPKGILMPNQFVRVRLKGHVRPNAILVPQRAVQQSAKGHFVWVVDKDNKAEMRPVTVGDWKDDDWFIFEGLKAGEKVVVDGVLMLSPGMPLTVKQATKPTAQPASTTPGVVTKPTAQPASTTQGVAPKTPPATEAKKKSNP